MPSKCCLERIYPVRIFSMSDDWITAGREIINARLVKDHKSLSSELGEIKLDYATPSVFRSSMYIQKVEAACKKHMETGAQIIFETLEDNLIGPGVVQSPVLNEKLKEEFLTHFDVHAQLILAFSEGAKCDEHIFKMLDLYSLKPRLVSEYNAKIDLLCRKLESEANKTG